MKKAVIVLAFLIIAVYGLYCSFEKSLRQQSDEMAIKDEQVAVTHHDNWLAWLQKRFPDESKTLWGRETGESLEKMITRDGKKWNFIWRGDFHRNGRPTALLMSTQDTRTYITAVKELRVMDCREDGDSVSNSHGDTTATGCKWVELLRLDAEGYFRNTKKIERFESDAPDGYYISFRSFDSFLNIGTGYLDSQGDIIPVAGYSYEFDKNTDSYRPSGEPAE